MAFNSSSSSLLSSPRSTANIVYPRVSLYERLYSKCDYSAMNIVVLKLFVELSGRILAMNHASSHGNSFAENPVQHLRSTRSSHSVDTTFGES
jgi:hypothetical protein